MIEKWTTPIPKLSGREGRTVYVYVPDEAQENPEARYPVLYMFDGHNVFFDSDATYGKCWGMKEYLESTNTPLIVVAVDCNHSRTTMDWFAHTLKGMIDEKYPTLPGRETTWIAGSSMGGLMSLYAVTAFNDVYSRAACLSPSIWFATRSLDRLIRDAQFAPDTVIYMDYGSREMAHHDNMRKQYAAVTSRLLEKQVLLTSRIVPNGDHCEACWEEQIPFFMHILFYNRE